MKKNRKLRTILTKARDMLRQNWTLLREERLLKLVLFIAAIILGGGALIYFLERRVPGGHFKRFFDALWWGIVTYTTVGYGDKYPVTDGGRVITSLMMLAGLVLTAVLSGTVASVFVDRKIQEGKGLKGVKEKNHTIICGWNKNAVGIADSFLQLRGRQKLVLVLVNEMDSEDYQILKAKYPQIDLRFVRGDFTHEEILKRAAIGDAAAAILIPDNSGSNSLENADERTILGALAIKTLNPEITTSAELINRENEQHLKRANVDDILVNGEFSGYLLAHAAESQGIPRVVKELLTPQSRNNILQQAIPAAYVGKSFAELSDYYLKGEKGILIGLLSEEKKMGLDDILSDDSAGIDAFIKRKFQEAEIDLAAEEEARVDIQLNPGPEYIIKESDTAFLIGNPLKGIL